MIFKQFIHLFVFVFLFFSFNSFTQNVKNEFVVVVDAGHGGKDPGNRGNGYFEKNIALNIALNVGEILTKIRLKLFTQEPKMFLLTYTSELKLQTMLMLIYLFQYIVMPTILTHMGQELLF